jgi:hypothetical protein
VPPAHHSPRERHLRVVLRAFVEHYHTERNHQGLANVISFPSCDSFTIVGPVARQQRLDSKGSEAC